MQDKISSGRRSETSIAGAGLDTPVRRTLVYGDCRAGACSRLS